MDEDSRPKDPGLLKGPRRGIHRKYSRRYKPREGHKDLRLGELDIEDEGIHILVEEELDGIPVVFIDVDRERLGDGTGEGTEIRINLNGFPIHIGADERDERTVTSSRQKMEEHWREELEAD